MEKKSRKGYFFGKMDRKFELHQGDVLTTYVQPEKEGLETEVLDGPFNMLCEQVDGKTVTLTDIAEPTRHYTLPKQKVEAGRIGLFVFEKLGAIVDKA